MSGFGGVEGLHTEQGQGEALHHFFTQVVAEIKKSVLLVTVTLTAAQILSTEEVVLCDATGGAFTVTLPSSPDYGQHYYIKKIDASVNAVTIDGGTIDGASSMTLPNQYDSTHLVYSSSGWWVIG